MKVVNINIYIYIYIYIYAWKTFRKMAEQEGRPDNFLTNFQISSRLNVDNLSIDHEAS
jgi:hypothetical protein